MLWTSMGAPRSPWTNSPRTESGQVGCTAADKVRTGDQHEDSEDARHDYPLVVAAARRQSDPLTERGTVFLCRRTNSRVYRTANFVTACVRARSGLRVKA